MKIFQGTALLVSLMAGAGLIVTGLPVLAGVDGECRQEAEDYGIPPEQLEEYVTGCVLSRGGSYVQESAGQEYTAPQEGVVGNDPGMDGDYVGDPGAPLFAPLFLLAALRFAAAPPRDPPLGVPHVPVQAAANPVQTEP